MKNLESIWRKPIYLPYLQPKLTDETIAQAEEKLGFPLPKAFLDLLRIQNGGYLRKTLPDSVNDTIFGIGPHFPSLLETDWSEIQDWVDFPLNGLIPFDGDGHWYICLDYRNNPQNPCITFLDLEIEVQEKVADSFADYLNLLKPDTFGKLIIKTETPLENMAKKLEEILQIKFEAPVNINHGYENYRGQYQHNWLWLNANKVPTGFVRENHPRYSELQELAQGTALQFPELPENALVLTCQNPAVLTRISGLLEDRGFENRFLEEMV